ncbi:MAG: hypothetical protein IPM74_13815 [Crocinitomicaceae bacterium]|nr:hypothetical protein [Crocinitomicaceae bacterium]MBK8926949.1 hypothetical protein [Crocinitomicaceae bacterium]
MRTGIKIFFLLILASCSAPNSDEKITNSENYTDTLISNPSDTLNNSTTLLPSETYLSFIKYLDSIEIKTDTVRFTKVSLYPNHNYEIINADGFPIYKLDTRQTAPFQNNSNFLLSHRSGFNDSLSRTFHIDTTKYLKAKNVWGHFFTFPEDRTSDAFFEEWEFSDSNTAKEIAEELDYCMEYAYMHRGAYIFYMDKHVYIFHSRWGIWPLKKIVKTFVERYNPDIPETTNDYLDTSL